MTVEIKLGSASRESLQQWGSGFRVNLSTVESNRFHKNSLFRINPKWKWQQEQIGDRWSNSDDGGGGGISSSSSSSSSGGGGGISSSGSGGGGSGGGRSKVAVVVVVVVVVV